MLENMPLLSSINADMILYSRLIPLPWSLNVVISTIEIRPVIKNHKVGIGSGLFAINGQKRVRQFPKAMFSSSEMDFRAGLKVFDSCIMYTILNDIPTKRTCRRKMA